MANYGHIIVFSLIGGVVSLIGGMILISRQSWAEKLATYATPFAAGALLAAVFLDLLKEGVEQSGADIVLLFALIGMSVFFLAERLFRWFHHHHVHADSNSDPTVGLIILGDTLHNALDGIAIAASFLISIPTGIITTIAVSAHEIPQEIGDFGVLLKKGLSRKKVILVNVLSALATVIAAVITFAIGSSEGTSIGALLGLSAGFLLYIAASDLIPTIHEESPVNKFLDLRSFLFIAGILIVAVSINIAHHFIG
jgi:zinc and cadmium transporter